MAATPRKAGFATISIAAVSLLHRHCGNLIDPAPLKFLSAENSAHRCREKTMKYLLSALTALFLFAYLAPDANAFVCARGVYRAGCVGPRGGVVVRRGPRCFWRGGVRICR